MIHLLLLTTIGVPPVSQHFYSTKTKKVRKNITEAAEVAVPPVIMVMTR